VSDLAGRWIAWFDALEAPAPRSLGGKCHNLAALTRLGLPVPPGFALRSEMFAAWLAETGLCDDALAEQGSARLEETPIAASFAACIADAYALLAQRVGAAAPRVAIRSSATTEDLPGASAAGQQVTVLDVCGVGPLLEAVKRCWASLYAPHAIAYRRERIAVSPPPALAVAVQCLVPARIAGVMFTADPLTGDPRRLVIEASWGLGEPLVGGSVTPDRYVLDRECGETIEQNVAEKTVELACSDLGSELRPVPAARRSLPCLTLADRARLAALAQAVEAGLGPAQDIEWAIDGEGRCFVLQARPITVAPRAEVSHSAAEPSRSPLLAEVYRRWTA
jgi:pyruvate,water dikinase